MQKYNQPIFRIEPILFIYSSQLKQLIALSASTLEELFETKIDGDVVMTERATDDYVDKWAGAVQ